MRRLSLGSGPEIEGAALNMDRRPGPGIGLVGDARRIPILTGSLDEVIASSILEHLLTPYEVLDEVHRVLRDGGACVVRVPALGTHAAHADPTHRFLPDLKTWRQILSGYFEEVEVSSEGVRFRDAKLLVAINHALVKLLGFHELAQTWTLHARRKRSRVERAWLGWWMTPEGRVAPDVAKELER